jgi:hypothetical protein
VRKEEEEAGWAKQAGGVAGLEVEKNHFRIKIGFLNLQRL